MDRRDFYFRQRVTQAELDDTFDRVELADQAIVADILGSGIFASPVVIQHTPQNLTVDVPALLAYDQLGRRVEIPSLANVDCSIDEVAASTAVVAPGNEKWLTLFVEFDRALSDPRTDGNGSTVYWMRDESFKVNVVQSAEAAVGFAVKPPPRSDQLILCDVRLISGQTQILNADINHLRREDFVFSVIHGSTHVESGGDPISLASVSNGGIVRLCVDGVATAGSAVQGNDSRLIPAYSLSAIRKIASKPSLIFVPKESSPFNTYRLHQYHGMAKGDYRVGSTPWEPADYYFQYDPSHSDYPLDVWLNGLPANKGPGRSDNTDVNWAQDGWYYCYIIARASGSPDKELAMVVSTQAPWAGGPVLNDTGGTVPFLFWNGGVALGSGGGFQGGWRWWRFVGCIVNDSAAGWDLVQMRKIGNNCSYELAQLIANTTSTGGLWAPVSCVRRIPPTSLRGFFRVRSYGNFGGGHTGQNCQAGLRPPALAPMGLKATPGFSLNQTWKIWAEVVGSTSSLKAETNADSGWVDVNEVRDVAYWAQSNTDGGSGNFAYVLGYEEFDDAENADLTW